MTLRTRTNSAFMCLFDRERFSTSESLSRTAARATVSCSFIWPSSTKKAFFVSIPTLFCASRSRCRCSFSEFSRAFSLNSCTSSRVVPPQSFPRTTARRPL